MSRRCPSCQAENAPQDQYCFQCGHSLRLQRPHTVILSTRRRFAGEDSDTPANTRPAPAIPPANASANPTTESEATTQEPTTGSAVADLDNDLTLTHPVPTDGAMVETAPTIIPALDTPVAAGVAPDVAETDDAHDTSDDPTAPLPWACAQCGTVNPAEDEYCSKCGAMNAPIPNKVTLTPPEVVPVAADTRKGWRLRTGWGTNVGTARKGGVDEDSVFAMTLSRAFAEHPETFGAFVVADGMGGQAAGEVASKMAIETIAAAVLRELGAAWVGGGALESEAIETTLRNAITAAHERITQSNSDDGNDKGTTVTMAVICDGVMHVANSGDSRTYLFGRGPGLIRVSHDHSLVQTLVDAGTIKPDEVYSDPRRNIITSALGSPDEITVDVFRRDLLPGDRILLCSDGLWEMARDEAIAARLFQLDDPQECTDELIALACRNGGLDNVSVIVVHADHI